jgi:hypothetical protein
MRAAWLLSLAFSIGCAEKVVPDPSAEQQDPPPSNGRFASATSFGPTTGSIDVAIPATNEGDYIYVMLTGTEQGGAVDDVFAANESVTLNLGGLMGEECPRWAWALRSTRPFPAGITSVAFTIDPGAPLAGFILVFSGLSEIGLNGRYAFNRGSSLPEAPTLESGVGNVVISMVGTCGSVGAIHEASPFTAIEPIEGIAIAYFIPDQPGSYGAVWTPGNGAYVTATEVLR